MNCSLVEVDLIIDEEFTYTVRQAALSIYLEVKCYV